MIDNPYARLMGEDNDSCLPVLAGNELLGVLAKVQARVSAALGTGPSPIVSVLDLEQLQVTDYAGLKGVDQSQAAIIRGFHKAWPIRADEMLLLGLRSLFQFAWPEPSSDDDIRYAASFDLVLNQVLAARAAELSDRFSSSEGLLPYWGRLAFLRVMVDLPTENVTGFGLDRVAVALVKKAKFNATTWELDHGSVIALNYALEPILKQLNRYLLHYHSTESMAGPARLPRAWQGVVPIVQHFWSNVAASKVVRPTVVLYGKEMAAMMHRLTSDQVDFIVGHELGHVAFSHPRRHKAAKEGLGDSTPLRHEFEFVADAFSLGLMRSRLVRQVKNAVDGDRESKGVTDPSLVASELHDYQTALGATYLLFLYMDFIQRAGELVRSRLGGQASFADRMDTHPRASERLRRLELLNAGEYLYTSKLQRYARDLFNHVLDYASSLSDDDLLATLE